MPGGLAIKTFAFSLSPPNSLLIVYGLEFEYEYTEAVSDLFLKKKKKTLEWQIFQLYYLFSGFHIPFQTLCEKMRKREVKEKFLDYHHHHKELFFNYKQDTLKLRSEEKGNLCDLSPSFCFEIWGRQNQLMWADLVR